MANGETVKPLDPIVKAREDRIAWLKANRRNGGGAWSCTLTATTEQTMPIDGVEVNHFVFETLRTDFLREKGGITDTDIYHLGKGKFSFSVQRGPDHSNDLVIAAENHARVESKALPENERLTFTPPLK